MYSFLLSNYNEGFNLIKDELQKYIKDYYKVVVLPWSFAKELETKNINEFFDETKEKQYLDPIKDLGIKRNNICILDCYKDSKSDMIKAINESDIMILTGGNPEMLYNKVFNAGILDNIKSYKNIVIGSSAGAELQLKKYFITKKNNYYNKFAWYDGFGIIKENFYFDVHSVNRGRYLKSLEDKSYNYKINIFCIFDSGAIMYNRNTKKMIFFGNVIKYYNSRDKV